MFAPQRVAVSFRLFVLVVVLGLINGFVVTTVTEDGIQLVIVLAFSVLTLVLAWFMREGRMWAQIALTVLIGIDVITFLVSAPQTITYFSLPSPGPFLAASALAQVVLAVAAVVLMYGGDTRSYFDPRR